MNVRSVHVRWLRTALGRASQILAAMSAGAAGIAVPFIISAFVFDPEEHRSARDRMAEVWAIWWGSPAVTGSNTWSPGTRFEERTVDGLHLITGITELPGFRKRWCYVRQSGGRGTADSLVELASASAADDGPLVTRWIEPSAEQSRPFGKTPSELAAAARSGCLMS